MKDFTTKIGISSKGLTIGITHVAQGRQFGYVAKENSMEQCLYHFIKYAHPNVILNKNLGKI